jgi:uncharacterized Zn-binding protein involved in type VI secretion/phage baseplate assembly protein gpV
MTVFSNAEAIARIKASVYDPRDPLWRQFYRHKDQRVDFQQAVVVENKDPDGLGRLRVHFQIWGDTAITGWIPLMRPFAGKDMGAFLIPAVGERVLCGFINANASAPIVMYSLHTQQQKSPAGTNKGNDRKIFSSPSGNTVILDDKKGGERIEVYMKQGKMRLVLDPLTGIEITNELGDIEIRCKNLTIEGEDTGEFKFKKGLTIEADGVQLKADKGIGIKTSGKVSVKGKIDLKGNGVLAGGKQMAKKNDQVVGIDKHTIMVPSISGLQPVPMIPHPYIGKLCDKLSQDVKIGGQPAATKGSKSKNNGPMHLPMPPGVQFQKPPDNMGEVFSGTIPKVKINGKEAAVLGSKVKTCSDPMPMENCQIIAMGVAPKLPMQIPVTNPIDRSLSNPKWEPAKVKIGEKVKLQVQLKNQYENAGVEFKVFPEGADVQNGQPLRKVYGTNIGGKAEAEWVYDYVHDPKNPLKKKPKFIYTADSFGCKQIKSPAVEFGAEIDIKCVDAFGNLMKKLDYELVNTGVKGQTPDDGIIIKKDTVPGEIVKFKFEEK